MRSKTTPLVSNQFAGLTSAQLAKSNPNLSHRPSPTAPEASESSAKRSQPSDISGHALQSNQPVSSLPFNMTRTTKGNQLPVYQLAKGGGTKHLTRLRRLSGDLTALKDDLTKALGVEGGYKNGKGDKVDVVSINWHTRQVLVRGWRAPEVVAWAESRGF